jgi:hypothetical protein
MSPDAVLSRFRNVLIAASVVATAAGATIVLRPARPSSPDLARGRLRITTERRLASVRTHVAGSDIDLAGLPFADVLSLTGHADVVGDLRKPLAAGERDFSGATGELAVSCDGCTLDYDPHVGDLHVGPISIDRLDARIVVAAGRLSIASWRFASRDLRLEVALDIQLAPRLEDSPITGCFRFAPTDALRARHPHLASLLETTGGVRDTDGLYNIRLAGTLGNLKKIGQACDGSHPATVDLDDAIAHGIARTGVDRYEIRRSLVERVLADPLAVARTVRIVPAIADGRPSGFKLYAIRAGSLFDELGFQNDDTVVSLDGFDVTEPDKALEAYTRLRDATSVEVAIWRHGDAKTLHYTVAR